MKAIDIRFFSSKENSSPKEEKTGKAGPKKIILTGYISGAGKLVFPVKIIDDLGIDIDNASFKVGMDEGKRKAKSLYVVSANSEQTDVFQFEKAAKSYTMSLPYILKKYGVDFRETKYVFTIHPFDYEENAALELQLSKYEAPVKVPYTGKPRGRKATPKTDGE